MAKPVSPLSCAGGGGKLDALHQKSGGSERFRESNEDILCPTCYFFSCFVGPAAVWWLLHRTEEKNGEDRQGTEEAGVATVVASL